MSETVGPRSVFFHHSNAEFQISGEPDSVLLTALGGRPDASLAIEVAAPQGQTLGEGVYSDAEASPSAEHPVLRMIGEPCEGDAGRFEVKHIGTNDGGQVDSLWIVFESKCEGQRHARFGEVRYRVPVSTPAPTIGLRTVRWPDAGIGTETKRVPVTVFNRSRRLVSVGRASVEGPNLTSFTAYRDDCVGRVLDPREACRVWLRFESSIAGYSEARLVVPLVSGGEQVIELSGLVLGESEPTPD
jgi:hypothetical protein